MKPILSVDFDGVLHSYTSGWKGAAEIPDPPVPGALAFLEEALKHFRVAIFSSRSNQYGGGQAMRAWLVKHVMIVDPEVIHHNPPWFAEIEWPLEKPAAFLTLDDRAMLFTGTFPNPEELLAFKPWNKP